MLYFLSIIKAYLPTYTEICKFENREISDHFRKYMKDKETEETGGDRLSSSIKVGVWRSMAIRNSERPCFKRM